MSDTQAHRHAAHTRIPNICIDFLMPLCTPAEAMCLMYILRHTVGFADPSGTFGRKERDVISTDQFVNGIHSGPYLFDFGCGLRSKDTVAKALKGLVEKGIVDVRHVCPKSLTADGRHRCDWEQRAGEPDPPPGPRTTSPACPRCGRSCTRSWAMAEITPNKLIGILNAHDPQKREFVWDAEVQRPRVRHAAEAPVEQPTDDELREEALRLRSLLFYPKLVDAIGRHAEGQLKAGHKISISRWINGFYKPALQMQERFVSHPPLIKYALEETVRHQIGAGKRNRTWINYTIAVAENNKRRFSGEGPSVGTNAAAARAHSPAAHESTMRELLARAGELNSRGERDSARTLLSDILAQVPTLAKLLFDGDEERCDSALREAFKQGTSDFLGVHPDPTALDFYEEWSWPAELAVA